MKNSEFQSVTIFVLASNETTLLRKTIDELLANCHPTELKKIVIVLKNKTCTSYATAKSIANEKNSELIEIYIQKSPTLPDCFAELPKLVTSTHFIIMAADMETDPKAISEFVRIAKEKPQTIICASKWHKDSTVKGYGLFHRFGTKMMNGIVSLILWKKVSDPFSIYQIYPKSIYDKIRFSENADSAFEYTLKALRCNFDYEEIPTTYINRTEGKSNFGYVQLFKNAYKFIITAIKVRLEPVNKQLNKTNDN